MTEAHAQWPEVDAAGYLRASFEPDDRLAILVRNRGRGETIQRITTAARIMEPSFQRWLHFMNDRETSDVYLGMNPLNPGARSRTKDDILTIRHVYDDLDHEGPSSLAAIDTSPLVPPPNYVLTTSPGRFQVIWRVTEISQEKAEALLRAMARKFRADPAATDSTRVLRLPGFLNRKYVEAILVTAKKRSDRVNHLLDFKLRIDFDSSYRPVRRYATRSTSADRPLSQSEHDWAFANRALARGMDPEEAIRRIAHFREGEKGDVLDYARRTVVKAMAEQQQRRMSGASVFEEPNPVDPTPPPFGTQGDR